MRILITGSNGLIGRELRKQLETIGHTVIGIDNKPEPPDVYCDVQSLLSLPLVSYDYIFHLACHASPAIWLKSPKETLWTILDGTANICNLGIPTLIASSSEVYGFAGEDCDEQTDAVVRGIGGIREAYSGAKRLSETIANLYNDKVMIARIHNTYGGINTGGARYNGTVIQRMIHCIKTGEVFNIYGNGMARRSYCHVSDTARGLIKMMEYWFSHGRVATVNIGNPTEYYSVASLWNIVWRTLGHLGEYRPLERHVEPRENEPALRRPNIKKAQELLAWEPQVKLESGLLI